MRVIFWHSIHKRELGLSEALAAGAARCGDAVELRPVTAEPEMVKPELVDCDAVCMVGVKMRDWFKLYRDAGVPVVFFDKGYVRELRWLRFWRVSINELQPIRYIETERHTLERWDSFRVRQRSSKGGSALLIGGSSGKAMQFFGIEDPNAWARDVVAKVRQKVDWPIIYRPKPSWAGAEPIEGTVFSRDRYGLSDCIKASRVMVVHSSNACFDAAMAGLQTIVLGDGITKPISSTTLDDFEQPRVACKAERSQWLANVAWCQFTLKEFAEGLGWRQIRTMIEVAA